jgi:dTDP-4-dehydrorhamnose reductase
MTFGPALRGDQFVERMLEHARTGTPLRVSDDVYDSPSYSMDITNEIQRVLQNELPYDLYHVCNRGRASLYELVTHITASANLQVPIERASYKEFPHIGIKNTNTPITTVRLKPLRSWQRAADHFAEIWDKEHPVTAT